MKKIQFLLTFFAAALLFGLIGCQKDVSVPDTQALTTGSETTAKRASLFESEPALQHDDVMEKIEAFKNRLAKIENGTLSKTDAPMVVEDAIWNIEALMNFRYCQAQLSFENVENPKATLINPT